MDLSNKVEVSGDKQRPFALGEKADMIHAHWYGGGEKGPHIVLKCLRGTNSDNTISRLRHELETRGKHWAEIEHPNLVKFYGLYFNYGRLPALVLQYCPYGNILKYVNDYDTRLSKQTKLQLTRDVAEGLRYLHQHNIVHGDLRSANVLITEDRKAALSDFGLSFIMDEFDFTTAKVAGSARWTAPEVLNPPQANLELSSEGLITKECDVFAFAMVVLEIYTGKEPFSDKKDTAALFAIIEGKRPQLPTDIVCVPLLREICVKCWDASPRNRLSADQICQFLSEINIMPSGLFQWLKSFIF